MEADLTQMQSYLYQQIIQKGYDPNAFQQFLAAKHENAQDLSALQFAQLKKIVAEFQLIEGATKSPEQVLPEMESMMPRNTEINFAVRHENYTTVLNCFPATPNRLVTYGEVKIQIQKFDKKEGGMFQKSFVCFCIETPCLDAIVERRYSDFQWLRGVLEMLHPGIPIPPLPSKGHARKFVDKHLRKRMMLLEMCLNKTAAISDLKGDMVFENFLTLKGTQFQKLKQQYKKIENIPLTRIVKGNGELRISLEPKLCTSNTKVQKFFQVAQPEVKRIYKGFKAAATCLEGAAASLAAISNICKNLNAKQYILCKETDLCYSPNNLYSMMGFTTAKYAELLNDQAKSFRKEVYSSVKYESFTMLNYLESMDKLATMQMDFTTAKITLQKRMDKVYDESTSKWGLAEKLATKPPKEDAYLIMFPKERTELMRLRQRYALFNCEIYEEIIRHYGKNNLHISKSMELLANIHSSISSDSMMLWATFLEKAKELRQGKGQQLTEILYKK